ncbi:MAG: CZB domain-containing protein [Hylemonella sp.]|nr:CZB domain-containing protein [Hylemonella sp.]MDH5709783.1 CZB domain-containing protein [Hylemonella sp.]
MLNWLKTLLGSQTSGGNPHISAETIARADSLMAGGTEEVAGLNFKTAIDAHMKWKARLRAAIDGSSDEQLDPQLIALDNQCLLGKWLHGPGGEKFGGYPRFKTLCAEHARFHRSAAAVAQLTQEKKIDEAKKEIEAGSYHDISLKVTGELAALYVEISSK